MIAYTWADSFGVECSAVYESLEAAVAQGNADCAGDRIPKHAIDEFGIVAAAWRNGVRLEGAEMAQYAQENYVRP